MSYEFDQLRESLNRLESSLGVIERSFTDHYTSMSNANAFLLQLRWADEANAALDNLAFIHETDRSHSYLACPFCGKPWSELMFATDAIYLFSNLYQEIATHVCELSRGMWPSQSYNTSNQPLRIIELNLRRIVQRFVDTIVRLNIVRLNKESQNA